MAVMNWGDEMTGKTLNLSRTTLMFFFISIFLSACIQEDKNKLKWESDFVLLKQELLQKDIGLKNNPEAAQRLSDKLDRVIQNLSNYDNDDQVALDLSRAIASVRQMHTSLKWDIEKVLPFELFMDNENLYVTATFFDHKQILYSRLVEINHYPVNKIIEHLSDVISRDNEEGLKVLVPSYIRLPSVLHGLGIIENKDEMDVTFEKDDGSNETMTVRTVNLNDFRSQHFNPNESNLLYLKHKKENYGFSLLSDERALYIAYNYCEESPNYSMNQFAEEILRTIRENPLQRLIIDLRFNPGGDSSVIQPLMEKLKLEKKVSDRVIILIGRGTASSAIMNAIQFHEIFGALLIGEPTNGDPNKPGDIRPIILPSTGLTVYYSTKMFHLLNTDNDALVPDLRVEQHIDDFKSGIDPILKAALTYEFKE